MGNCQSPEVERKFKVVQRCRDVCKARSYTGGSEPKNIVVSFDGTGGVPGWGIQEKLVAQELYKGLGGLSNVCKLHLLAGGNVGCSFNKFPNQIPLYYSGVGTRGRLRLLKSAFGLNEIANIYEMAYRDLEKIYEEGDKIFIFGFSRGAATARLFSSYLQKYKLNGITPKIAFLGVYDTVLQSSGVSNKEDAKYCNVDYSPKLPDIVEKAVHFVSIDEAREPFLPTLFNRDPRVTEIWCPGNHSDIGGGYYHDGLSDNTLQLMQKAAMRQGLLCREITEDTCQNHSREIVDDDLQTPDRLLCQYDKDMVVTPDACDPDIHTEKSKFYDYTDGDFTGRTVAYKEGATAIESEPILLLDSTIERIKNWKPVECEALHAKDFEEKVKIGPYKSGKYRPENIKNVPYKIVSSADLSVDDTVHTGFAEAGWE